MAFEERMLLDLQDHIEIARRSAVSAGVAFMRKTHARAVIHAGGDIHLELALRPGDNPGRGIPCRDCG